MGIAANRVGTLKPAAPVLVEHTPNDDVIPSSIGKQLGKDWCAKGADVRFQDIPSFSPVFSHVLVITAAQGNAANWLAERFAGKPTAGNCGRFQGRRPSGPATTCLATTDIVEGCL
ncbi:lipase family protein [Amycolatopsis speibonae]|uniref:Lipase family protein n=1 Tax=Amycolatopsis speibonae TaxID=1450224 RepID=A0ABV7NTW1_9PSEU